ncbi:adenine phosphoribosyltransferase [Candidatus Woesearchaeota archaeon]|nr:adenine phosphoribosyltransferase [Candidatus Woesearchaeota archaeon]
MDLKETIRTIPDWPKKGIMFRDITTLLQNGGAFKQCCDELYERYKDKKIDAIVGIESRGFIFGSVLAHKLGISFVPIRKPGKLPSETIKQEYELEYGKDVIEIHKDAIKAGDKVLIVDDLIATGGSMAAAVSLVKKLEGDIVECCFVIELPDLNGREKLKGQNIFSMMKFEGD